MFNIAVFLGLTTVLEYWGTYQLQEREIFVFEGSLLATAILLSLEDELDYFCL